MRAMFKKLFDRLMDAATNEENEGVLYAEDGVDMMFQREKITWEDHQRLFNLAARLQR